MGELKKLVMGLMKVNHESKYHPETNVFNHTIQVVFSALAETDDVDLITACLLHDVGKNATIYEHEQVGAKLVEPYVNEKVRWLVENHLRINYYLCGKMRSGKAKMLFSSKWFPDLVRLRRWDVMGRDPDFRLSENVLEKFGVIVDKYLR